MNAPEIYDAVFSHQIGRYSDAVRVPSGYDQIVVSGTPGLDENGNIPADFADEARQVWRNVAAILEKAGASISDIVSIRQYLTRQEEARALQPGQPVDASGLKAPGPPGPGLRRVRPIVVGSS